MTKHYQVVSNGSKFHGHIGEFVRTTSKGNAWATVLKFHNQDGTVSYGTYNPYYLVPFNHNYHSLPKEFYRVTNVRSSRFGELGRAVYEERRDCYRPYLIIRFVDGVCKSFQRESLTKVGKCL